MTRKDEQVRKAMLRYLEGTIHPEELEGLNRVVESDPQVRRELAELMLQDALLTKVSQETEFFELDDPKPVPPPSVSCRTSRIMKITRRAPIVDAPPSAPAPRRRVWIAAAAALIAISAGIAAKVLTLPSSLPEPVTTVVPVVAPAPAATLPEEPVEEPPVKAVVATPEPAKPAPTKAKAPATKPKASTARKEPPAEPKPGTTSVPEGFLTLPSSNKLPPPAPTKPAPKIPPQKTPPPKPPAQK